MLHLTFFSFFPPQALESQIINETLEFKSQANGPTEQGFLFF